MDLTDKTVFVVTGTSDSGKATVRTAADAGGTVGFTYNTAADEASELLDSLDGDGHAFWQCDVTDTADVQETVDEAFDQLDGVDALVYNAGLFVSEPIRTAAVETWNDVLEVNVTGAFNVVHAAADHFARQGHGSIVALSASSGIIRDTDLAAFDASKRALEALVEETARELGPQGVRANVVAPGFIRDPDSLPKEDVQALRDQQPYKQLTAPEDVASSVLFLCSDAASTVTGAVLPVDSGLALE